MPPLGLLVHSDKCSADRVFCGVIALLHSGMMRWSGIECRSLQLNAGEQAMLSKGEPEIILLLKADHKHYETINLQYQFPISKKQWAYGPT